MSKLATTLNWLGGLSLAVLTIAPAAQAQVAQQLSEGSARTAAAASAAIPMQRRLRALPREALLDARALVPARGAPQIVPGNPGPRNVRAPREIGENSADGMAPQNHGLNNLNTIFHYTDYQVSAQVRNEAPYRFSGWFVFSFSDGGTFRCTASLISRSIAVTAGHCVHQGGGGNGSDRFIAAGTYYPAYRDGASPQFGSATANLVVTTSGWANVGEVDGGYDVGLVVLNKKANSAVEIGTGTGWYGFCTADCLQAYWYNSQIGYPANYYGGRRMTQGEHLERSDSRDYIYGSGMQGGSSGGPHVANFGALADSSSDQGRWPFRNIVLATTSWGYTDEQLKIQGASSLSGPGNSNNFRAMWNRACGRARALHGVGTCNLL